MEQFRWAYVGSGNIAKSTARSITKGAHCITAVFSRNTEKAKAFAAKYGAAVYTSFEELQNRWHKGRNLTADVSHGADCRDEGGRQKRNL